MGHVTELHLHLDGSLRPETVWELAKEQGIRLPAESAEEVKYKMEVPEDCRTLEEYLERLANGYALFFLKELESGYTIMEAALNAIKDLKNQTGADEGFNLLVEGETNQILSFPR